MGLYAAIIGSEDVEWLKFIGITLGYSILGGLAAIVIVYIVLPCIGFTCCGVLACSCAACCQSSIGDVEAGSCFACCQSAGAGGKAAACLIPVLFVAGFALTATLLILHKVNHSGSDLPTNSTMDAFLVNGTRVFDLVN